MKMAVAAVSWELYEMFEAFLKAPVYHLALEALLFVWVLWLLLRKSAPLDSTASKLTEKEKDELIAEWTPEPLVPDTPADHHALHPRVITSKVGKNMVVDGRSCLNLASHNYLSLTEESQAQEASLAGLHKYGVGSCGPRGFFGTVDIHLELESRLAEFMGVEEACLYSYGFSTMSSAIPSYAKQGDIIYVDEEVCLAVQMGLKASRSTVQYFRHNDMEDLERLLVEQQEKDRADPRKASVTRRFLIVEGVYASTGNLCPLPRLVELRARFQLRLFVEESCSFGVLGRTGRGVREHFNVPSKEIDLMCATLENAIGSFGGFCCGTSFVVDHQRLSGLGYCFSASLPPLQASVSMWAIDHLTNHPEILTTLRRNCLLMHEKLKGIPQLRLGGDDASAIKHLYVTGERPRDVCCRLLDQIVHKSWEEGVALTRSRYLEPPEHLTREPSIRIAVCAALTEKDIDHACGVISRAAQAIL